jgi:hypothetical protein
MHWVGKNLCSNLFSGNEVKCCVERKFSKIKLNHYLSVLANELDPNESELDSQKFNFELNLREALCELFCSLQKCEDFEQDHFWIFLDLFEKFVSYCNDSVACFKHFWTGIFLHSQYGILP